VDGDGWLDLFVANDATGNYLYHNNKGGTLPKSVYSRRVSRR